MPANQYNTLNLSFGFGSQVSHISNQSINHKPPLNNSVAHSALEIVNNNSNEYTIQAAPTSSNPLISENNQPGTSKLQWLRGKNKCNIFIGEALTTAGYAAPMYKMADGSYHYVNAENLIKYRNHFQIIQNKKDIRPGDVMVIDYKLAQSENGAHAEVVTDCDPTANFLQTAGAHKDGAYIKNNSDILKKVGNNLSTSNFLLNICANVYFLRPTKVLSPS
jgi:hypothetical protein